MATSSEIIQKAKVSVDIAAAPNASWLQKMYVGWHLMQLIPGYFMALSREG